MVVFWAMRTIDSDGALRSYVEEFPPGPDQLKAVIARCAELRRNGVRYVTMASADVSASGVMKGPDGVWRLPNGEPYTWTKRRPPDLP